MTPSEIYPAVRRFLVECGLQRTLKSFDKETGADEAVDAVPAGKAGTRTSALAELELATACKLWLDTHSAGAAHGATNGAAPADDDTKKNKKRRNLEAAAVAEEESEAAVTAVEAETKAERKKKRKAAEAEAEKAGMGPAIAEEATPEAVVEEAPKRKKKKEAEEGGEEDKRKSGVPFTRVDFDKWTATIKDKRLVDNTHEAKQKYGGTVGDSWGDSASADLLAVKGKGFRKEMAKKKRASWRGGGEIDQGVNSIPFSDSDDE